MPNPPSKLQLAMQHLNSGKPDQARAILRRHLQQHPGDLPACRLMANVLSALGEHAQAKHFANKATTAAPNDPNALTDLAVVTWRAESPDAAEAVLRRALAVDPGHVPAGTTLATVMGSVGRYADAVEACRPVLAASGNHPGMVASFAHLLTQLGRAEEAVDLLRAAIRAHPEIADLAKELPSRINYDPRATPGEVFEAHTRYARLLEKQWAARPGPRLPPPPRPHPDEADRPLRVGIVSADLHTHSVSYFIEPVLHHHDPAAFHITGYHTGKAVDETTLRLRQLADEWRHGSAPDHVGLARQVRDDRIDILIELSGHTAGNSLPALLMRPAPVQVTYMGYPNTTGLGAVDARLVDSQTDPPGTESLATERLVRLDPCFICYKPPGDAPAIGPPPCASAGHVTFGSFNSMLKTNDRLLRLWARVLAAVPGSRFVLKNRVLHRDDCQRDLASRLAAVGVEPGRVHLFHPIVERTDHLGAYALIDVAMDTVPYAGTTTTCEAMYMGVPTVTLAGRSHLSRVGLSLLSVVGLGELVAQGEDDYVRLAVSLASDRARLAEFRRTLRPRMLASPLCDGPAFTARFQAALRALWRAHVSSG